MKTICKTRHKCTYNHYILVSNWVFIMQRPLEIWLSFTNKKWQCAGNLFQIHHTEQTPVVFVPKVVIRIVGKMPTTTCCKPLKSDFPITFVRLHFAFEPWAKGSMYWDTNCLTKLIGMLDTSLDSTTFDTRMASWRVAPSITIASWCTQARGAPRKDRKIPRKCY